MRAATSAAGAHPDPRPTWALSLSLSESKRAHPTQRAHPLPRCPQPTPAPAPAIRAAHHHFPRRTEKPVRALLGSLRQGLRDGGGRLVAGVGGVERDDRGSEDEDAAGEQRPVE